MLDSEPHLLRQFGPLLADLMCSAATDAGVSLVRCPAGAELAGEPVSAVRTGDGRLFEADMVVFAVGCQPNVEWLLGSGIGAPGGVLVDDRCRPPLLSTALSSRRATWPPGRTPRGDRAGHRTGTAPSSRREPPPPRSSRAKPLRPRPYFWTEQWGLDIKICGELHPQAVPHVTAGSMAAREVVVQWTLGGAPVAAASVNHRMPIAKLRKLATTAPVAA